MTVHVCACVDRYSTNATATTQWRGHFRSVGFNTLSRNIMEFSTKPIQPNTIHSVYKLFDPAERRDQRNRAQRSNCAIKILRTLLAEEELVHRYALRCDKTSLRRRG